LHPGGNLGRRLLKVADVMHRDEAVPLAPLGTRMSEAIVIMSAKSFGCVGITDGRGQLIGIVTDGDLRRHMVPDLPTLSVDEVMSASPRTIGADALAAEALAEMNGRDGRRPITSLFVAEDGRPIGILHVHDCLRAGVV
jgi:arabinose-5-phosphate isomerase